VSVAAERVERILTDPVLARRLGAAGRARAESLFNWDRTAAALLAAGSTAGAPAPVAS
jgi:glycosyltransferase involved in cell wall biosynthesis